MTIVCVVQARMGSSRLPGKSLRPLAGKPMILHVLTRAMQIDVEDTVLATSVSDNDDLLAQEASDAGVFVFRGHETDVLQRFVDVASAVNCDAVMRVTGDCPLLDPAVCKEVARIFRTMDGDYVSNVGQVNGYPDGFDCEVFTVDLLREAHAKAKTKPDREHVTPWMRRHAQARIDVRREPNYGHHKLSVDTIEDFERVRAVLAYCEQGNYALQHTLDALWESQQ